MERMTTESGSPHEKIGADLAKNIENQGEILGYPKVHVEHVVALIEKGLNSENIIGYHGTSLEALQEGLRTGLFRGAMKSEGELGSVVDDEHSFFFFPIKEKFESHPDVDKFHTDSESSEGAEMYAHLLAGAHFLLSDLNLGINDKVAVEHAKSIILWQDSLFNIDAPEAIKYFTDKGIEKKDLMKRAERAAKRKGVVLGINALVKDAYELTDPLQGEGDLSVQIPEGLSLENLAGVEPLSQDEWDFFMHLQGELKKEDVK